MMALAFAFAAFIDAIFHAHAVDLSTFLSSRIKIQNFAIIMLFFISWQLIFRLAGFYRSRRLGNRSGEIFDIFKATTIATALLLAAGFIFKISLIDINFLFAFWAVSSLLLITSRLILRFALKEARLKGHNTRQMVIIGTSERAKKFANKIDQSPELGYHIIGFIDNQWEGIDKFNGNGAKILGSLADIPKLLKNQVIDEAVISLPVKSHYDEIRVIIKLCEEQGIIVRFLSDIFNLEIAKSQVDHLEDIPILTMHTAPISQWPLLVKRFIDIAVSSILLMLLSPLFLLVTILIKLDSKGTVFFIQERMGFNKRRFKVLKFRTMVVNAEKLIKRIEKLNEVSGPVFKIKNDPRLTRLGKWLRKTSIDELPQLINVLAGDMSLVGPRPLPVRDYRGFDQNWYRRRFSVRPGITCTWQVNGRSDIAFEKWMKLDMEYIDNWSMWLDLQILAKTIPAVIRGSGAA